jgi:hypothetical protein
MSLLMRQAAVLTLCAIALLSVTTTTKADASVNAQLRRRIARYQRVNSDAHILAAVTEQVSVGDPVIDPQTKTVDIRVKAGTIISRTGTDLAYKVVSVDFNTGKVTVEEKNLVFTKTKLDLFTFNPGDVVVEENRNQPPRVSIVQLKKKSFSGDLTQFDLTPFKIIKSPSGTFLSELIIKVGGWQNLVSHSIGLFGCVQEAYASLKIQISFVLHLREREIVLIQNLDTTLQSKKGILQVKVIEMKLFLLCSLAEEYLGGLKVLQDNEKAITICKPEDMQKSKNDHLIAAQSHEVLFTEMLVPICTSSSSPLCPLLQGNLNGVLNVMIRPAKKVNDVFDPEFHSSRWSVIKEFWKIVRQEVVAVDKDWKFEIATDCTAMLIQTSIDYSALWRIFHFPKKVSYFNKQNKELAIETGQTALKLAYQLLFLISADSRDLRDIVVIHWTKKGY